MRYLRDHPAESLALAGQHVALVATALAIALAVAVPISLLVWRRPRAGAAITLVLGAIYTLPSLAVFALLIPLLGLGFGTALTALVAYVQMILVRNIVGGLRSVPPALVDAARGLGMTRLESFVRVELPQALPAIVAGIRIATVALIGLASLAAWIGAGGLGTLLFRGLEENNPDKIVAGSCLVAAIAVGTDAVLLALERRVRRATGRLD